MIIKKEFIRKQKAIGAKYGMQRKKTNTEILNFVAEKDRAKRAKAEKVEYKNKLKDEWEKNKGNIKVFEDKIELVKSKIDFVKGILKEYYINLLKQGVDTRYEEIYI